MLIRFTTTVILGHYPCNSQEGFAEQILKNYEWKHFRYNGRKIFSTNLEVRGVGMDKKRSNSQSERRKLWYLVNDQSYFKTTDPRCDNLINHTYKTFNYLFLCRL